MTQVTNDIAQATMAPGSPHDSAWRAIRGAHQALVDAIEHDLAAESLPALAWFDVLAKLESEPAPLRPKDMLCQVSVTKSGLTRLLDRIEEAGLIARSYCPSDRRGTFLTITDEGRQTLEKMKPVRGRVFEEHLAGQMSPAEAETVGELLDRVVASAGAELEAGHAFDA
jgi:DNA-binding MarR family transcriptional regulator